MGFNDHNINLERPPSSMKEAYSKIFSWILKPSAIKSEEAGLAGLTQLCGNVPLGC